MDKPGLWVTKWIKGKLKEVQQESQHIVGSVKKEMTPRWKGSRKAFWRKWRLERDGEREYRRRG